MKSGPLYKYPTNTVGYIVHQNTHTRTLDRLNAIQLNMLILSGESRNGAGVWMGVPPGTLPQKFFSSLNDALS